MAILGHMGWWKRKKTRPDADDLQRQVEEQEKRLAELQSRPPQVNQPRTNRAVAARPRQPVRAGGDDVLLDRGGYRSFRRWMSTRNERDAAMSDFKTIMISDGNATRSDEDHLATLRTFIAVFGDVRTTDQTVALLQAGRPKVLSAAE